MTNAENLIQWLLDNKLASTSFHKKSREQLIEITEFGIEINTILEKLRTTSKEAEETNKILENANDD